MAKIKQANKTDVVAVFEDPRPTSNTIYFFGSGHNKQSLAPVFDQHIRMHPTNGAWQTYGETNSTDSDISAGGPGNSMALSKQSSHVIHTTATGNDTRTCIDFSWGLSMDPSNPSTFVKHFTDGTTDMVTWTARSHSAYYDEVYWSSITDENELSDFAPSHIVSQRGFDTNYGNYNAVHGWLYRDPNTEYISGLYHRTSGGVTGPRSRMSPTMGITRLDKFPNYSTRNQMTYREYYVAQFIGASEVDGKPIYLFNDRRNDRTQIVIRHNTSDNTETTLHTFNTTPSASGSNYGGERATGSGLDSQTKISSQTFDDPSSSGNTCWYTPYFDTSNNYFPFFYQWDKSTDTFTRNEDVTVSGDLSGVHLGNLHGCQGDNSGTKSILYNETFVLSGTRYISVFPLDGGYQVNDANDSARTVVTYSVDAANPKALTHHSASTVPQTIRNIVWLNDARTQFGAICENSFHFYNFDATNGWTLTASLPFQFWSVGRDSADKIYATSYNATGHVDVHLITPTIPLNIVISAASDTYDYQGTTINTNVSISAYNSDGNRVATNVNLRIEGSTMTFDDDSISTTVTTSDSADVTQAIKIIGAGFSNIVASVQV